MQRFVIQRLERFVCINIEPKVFQFLDKVEFPVFAFKWHIDNSVEV